MSLGKCDRCQMRLRFGSAKCARCGTTKKRLKYLLAGVVLAEAGTIVAYMNFKVTSVPHIQTAAAAELVVTDVGPPAGWVYFKTRDEMIDDTTRHARVLSRGNPVLGNPGDHGTTGVLELRASPTYGKSVVITLRRDTFGLVDENCVVRARFDAGDEQVFRASGSLDGDNATLIVDDTQGFTGHLIGAHTLSVDAQLSEKTRRIANFDVGGLNWN